MVFESEREAGLYQAQLLEEQMKSGEKDKELERLRVDLAKLRGAEATTATVVVDASQPQITKALEPVAEETRKSIKSTQNESEKRMEALQKQMLALTEKFVASQSLKLQSEPRLKPRWPQLRKYGNSLVGIAHPTYTHGSDHI
jgi:hypothetical protein